MKQKTNRKMMLKFGFLNEVIESPGKDGQRGKKKV